MRNLRGSKRLWGRTSFSRVSVDVVITERGKTSKKAPTGTGDSIPSTAKSADPSFCATLPSQDLNYTSYSTHNLTVLPDVAIVAWHSDGLRAVDISDPANPVSAGAFVPEPLASVATEDPALSRGIVNHVVMWSYPIIKDGLIYVVDIRNGLYVLRYTGPHADEVSGTGFLEGNSNLGDAVTLEPSSS